ncbi:MAG TPA: PilZ domain-containing protein [Phycisphaerae bacterium]|nr:PilZ domain-containing protein [Phycisphaerae bacterium]
MIRSLQKAICVRGKLDTADVVQILDQLDHDSKPHDRLYRLLRSRRRHERYRYRVRGICVALFHGGKEATLIVSGRNLSAGGVAFLHTDAIEISTPCQVRLVDRDGQDQHITGAISRCRHVKAEVYEIGVQFDETIDPRFFVDQTVRPAE